VLRNVDAKVMHWDRYGFGQWLLRERITGAMVGRGGLQLTFVAGCNEVEVGWAIIPERWGQGLATELAVAAVEVAFDDLGVGELVAFTLPDNIASRRVMEKAGFTYERAIVHFGLPHVLYRRTAGLPPGGGQDVSPAGGSAVRRTLTSAMPAQHAPENVMDDPGEIARFYDRCSDLMRELLDALAAAPDQPRPFPEIEDAVGWPHRRIASVLGGVSHLRHTEFGGRRPYRFQDPRHSASGRWEMWMDGDQGQAARAAQRM
jgi:Acetyltransferase (GNAT) domain